MPWQHEAPKSGDRIACLYPPRDVLTERFGRGSPERAREHVVAMTGFLANYLPNTRRAYTAALRSFFLFTNWLCPEDVTAAHASAWKAHLLASNKSRASAHARLSALRSYYEYLRRPYGANRPGIVTFNPFASVPLADVRPDPYGRATVMEWDTFRRLLGAQPDVTAEDARDRAILVFFAYTGRRLAEVASLRVGDLDLESRPRTYRCTLKRGKVATFELPDICYETLLDYWKRSGRLERLRPHEGVFSTSRLRRGHAMYSPLSDDGLGVVIYRAKRRAGMTYDPATAHSLRHMYARDLERAGASTRDIQEALAHSTIATTEVYMKSIGKVRRSFYERLRAVREQPMRKSA